MAHHLVRKIVEEGYTVEVERLLKDEARSDQFCDHGWVGGYGDPPICRRKARRRVILFDSEGRLVASLECCDRPGCLSRDLGSHFLEVQAATASPSKARTEVRWRRDIFDDLDDGLLDRDEADRLFAMLDAHDLDGDA